MPASVDQILNSPGRPLEAGLRQDMEERFGHDFSQVRVHSGAAAEQSARDVNAHAYTVGQDIVFGEGKFVSGTREGRRLIAHELTHVLQQTDSSNPTRVGSLPVRTLGTRPMLSRVSCEAMGCPLVTVPLAVGPLVPSWRDAERCLQHHYKKTTGHTCGFNKDWVGVTSKNEDEQIIIDRLRPHFTGRGFDPEGTISPKTGKKKKSVSEERQGSQQRQAEPDIFDFTKLRIMEITTITPANVAYREMKVEWEVGQANGLMAGIKSPNTWQIGWWTPAPCYKIIGAGSAAGRLYFRTWRIGGVLAYLPVIDLTKEAVALAIAAAVVKSGVFLALWNRVSTLGKLGKEASGPLVAATAVAALIMLANGAELSADPSEDGILEAFFKHASDNGMEIPDDVKTALKKNKKLRDLLVKAGRKKGGDMSDEARQAMEEITKTIAEHADEFTDEELEQLVKAAEETQEAIPNSKMSVEELKKALKSKGKGQKSKVGDMPSTTTKPATTKLSEDVRKRIAADEAAKEILEEFAVSKGSGLEFDDASAEKLLKILRDAKPPLTAEDAKEIMAVTTFSKDNKIEDLLEAVRKRVEERRPAVLGGTSGAPGVQTPSGPPPPLPAPATPTIYGVEDITTDILFSPTLEAHRIDEEKKASAKAREVLKNPIKYGKIKDGELYYLRKEGDFSRTASLPKNFKINVDFTVRLVGRKNGMLFTGAVYMVVKGPVGESPGEWNITRKSAPMYGADGSKVMVLRSVDFKARMNELAEMTLTK